jgi:Phage tail tube protein
MAIGSGLAAQLGMIQEVTPGTALSPTHFYEFNSETLNLKPTTIQGTGLRAGQVWNRASRRARTLLDVTGGVLMDFPSKGGGFILQQLLGSFNAGATPVQQGGSTAYLQTHLPGSNWGKSFTLQKGAPDSAGTVHALNYPGCKVTDWTLDCKVGAILSLQMNLDAFNEVLDTPALATPSYIAGSGVFNFRQGTLLQAGTVATVANVSSVSGSTTAATVTGVQLKGKRPMADKRYFYGGAGIKAEQIENGYPDITGQIDVEFASTAAWYAAFAAGTSQALELKFVGPLIASTFYQTLDIILPCVFLEGDSPNIAGPDVLKCTVPFTVLDGEVGTGTTAQPIAQFQYISTDTAI